jgi:hypothetical protein
MCDLNKRNERHVMNTKFSLQANKEIEFTFWGMQKKIPRVII